MQRQHKVAALVALLMASGLVGCGAGARASRMASGSWRIQCGSSFSSCAQRAQSLCGDDGLTVLSGGTHTETLGGATSAYQSKSYDNELVIVCGEDAERPAGVPSTFTLPARTDAAPTDATPTDAVPTDAAPAASSGASATANAAQPAAAGSSAASCTPGATQRCVGAGACDGGQACLADGSGFGPCDCGGGASGGAAWSEPSAPGAAPAAQPSP